MDEAYRARLCRRSGSRLIAPGSTAGRPCSWRAREWSTATAPPPRAISRANIWTHSGIELSALSRRARSQTRGRSGACGAKRLSGLNLLAAPQPANRAAASALAAAWRAPFWIDSRRETAIPENEILALGSGAVVVTPGRASRNRPVVLVASPYLPFPLAHGGAVRMYNLMRRAARDFDQVLVPSPARVSKLPRELLEICCEIVLVKRPGRTCCLPRRGRMWWKSSIPRLFTRP